MARTTTRRRLLAAAIAASAVPAVPLTMAAPALGQIEPDAQLIAGLLGLQQLEAFAYRRLLASTPLDGDAKALLARLQTLELEHAAALSAELVRLGATAGAGPADVAAADRELARHPVAGRLAGTRSQHDCIKLLIELESAAEGGCYRVIVKLADAQVARLVAEVMSSEAQQWTLLDQLQHHDVVRAVPGPFVEGTK